MTLTVEIRRRATHEKRKQAGTLTACVIQGQRRGKNLLAGRQITNVASARRQAASALKREYPLSVIEWAGEDPKEATA